MSNIDIYTSTVVFSLNGIEITPFFKDGEAFLSAEHIASLFRKDVSTARKHLKDLEKRLESNVSAKKAFFASFAESRFSGHKSVLAYNIEYVIRIGYMFNGEIAEAFQDWASSLVKREIKEQADPSLILDRGVDALKASGATGDWIAKRVEGKVKRVDQVQELWDRGVQKGYEIGLCTNAQTKEMTGYDKNGLVKYLTNGAVVPKKSKPAKEYMTPVELGIQGVADDISRELMKQREARGLKACKECCAESGAAMKSAWDIAQKLKNG